MKFKFAVVEGERREAQPRLSGKCAFCGDAMIAKCGKIKAWHWAHRATRTCDPWWEPETGWHRDWKSHFPKDCQEIIHQSADGEKHIADVKTERGVLEFQHSHLRQEERVSREMFYRKMVWVVDGLKRTRDRPQFFAALATAIVVSREPPILWVRSNGGALLRDWRSSGVPVYFDFGPSEPSDTLRFDAPILWRLNPCTPNGMVYLSPVPKTTFLRVHLKGEPFEEIDYSAAVERIAAHYLTRLASLSRPLSDFERYMARRRRRRF